MIYSWRDAPRNQAFDPDRADLSLFSLRDSSFSRNHSRHFATGRYLASACACACSTGHERADDRDCPRKAKRRCSSQLARSARSSGRNHRAIRSADIAVARQNSRCCDRGLVTHSLAVARSAKSARATRLRPRRTAASQEHRRNRWEERSVAARHGRPLP
jgi:hypothetical protein